SGHAHYDQAPDLVGLRRIDLFVRGRVHERLEDLDRGPPTLGKVRPIAKIGHGRNPSSWPRRMARARRLRAASRRFLLRRGAELSPSPRYWRAKAAIKASTSGSPAKNRAMATRHSRVCSRASGGAAISGSPLASAPPA